MIPPIDQASINFSPTSLMALNAILGVVMFGIALDLKNSDFAQLLRNPKPVLTGMAAQFLALPALTFALVYIAQPQPSIALGLMLVAACPGGNVSNFFSHRAGGNAALSVSLTAIATVLAVVMTPLNLSFWAGLYPPTAEMVRNTALDPLQMALTLSTLLLLPMLLGMWLNHRHTALATRLRKPIQTFSMIFFAVFIIAALAGNWVNFKAYIGLVLGLVFAHNATALTCGYGLARLTRLSTADTRAVTVETGIQNSGLGLILIFSFFNGLGGMAVVAAWWGVWHIIAGFTLSHYWHKHPTESAT